MNVNVDQARAVWMGCGLMMLAASISQHGWSALAPAITAFVFAAVLYEGCKLPPRR